MSNTGNISSSDHISGRLSQGGSRLFGLVTNVKALSPEAEEDKNVLNLLAEYGYSAAVSDMDGYVITDADNNIILG